MSRISDQASDGAQQAQDSDALDWAVRGGLVAYGVVHLVVAFLAINLAIGGRSEDVSTSGAMSELAKQPLGSLWLWLIVVGMALLVLWQGLEAVIGRPDEEDGPEWGKRAASVLKAVIYGVICFSAAKVVLGSGSSGGSGGGQDSMTSQLMSLPAGQWLVVAAGLAVMGYGGYKVYQGLNEEHAKKLASEGKSGEAGRAYLLLGKVGYIVKGLALAGVGALFVWAGVTHDAQKSGGLDQAFGKLLQQPFGPVLVVAVGLGFAAYGVFSIARARHLSR